MPLHLGPRWHAFTHGLFRSSDEAETRMLFDRVYGLFERHGLTLDGAREGLVADIAIGVLAAFGLEPDHRQAGPVAILIARLLDDEQMFVLPEINWTERRSVTAWWALRDALNEQRPLVEDFEGTKQRIGQAVIDLLAPLYGAAPALLASPGAETDITVASDLVNAIANPGDIAEAVLAVFFDEDLVEARLFARTTGRLERNLIAASGGNPADPKSFNRAPKLPSRSDIKNPADLLATYLGGMPVLDYLRQKIDVTIPTPSRFEHHHIVAGSGHGKTQTLQYLISQDLDAVALEKRSVVVLDSQGDLIRNISNLAEFAPDGPLHDRVVIIDPTDVEYPVSLNLFDVGIDRLKGYAPLERERLINSILELYDFVLGTLLSAEMTQKQSVIFRYVTRLMLHIPDATIHTLRELMEPNSAMKFAGDIAKLQGTARHFFETEFASREFEQTKKQVLRRLWGILENQTFERMFSHPRSKLDLFREMNAGKVILINTAKDLLKEQGTEIFGRFFIALIAQAAQERATLPEYQRMPTFVYIDEAADYFDRNIGIILAQARKYNVGMVLAHQYLGQLDPRLQEAFAANTSIKFAGGVSARDARALAPMLYCEPRFIEAQPKGSFAAHIRGVTKSAVPFQFPLGVLEQKPKMSHADRDALQAKMRDRYAVHYTALDGLQPEDDDPAPEDDQDAPPVEKSENRDSRLTNIPDTEAGPEL